MRFAAACVIVASIAGCGGQIADDGDAGDAAVKADVVTKKDAPIADVAPDVIAPLDAGVNVSGNGPSYESEDQIAVASDGTIAILWQAFTQTAPYIDMQYAFSTDDGKTFSTPKSVNIETGLYPGDPALAVDANGNFIATYLGIAYSGQNVSYTRVYAAMAPKGTFAFGAPSEVSAPGNTTDLNDHPKVFVTSKGTFLVGWADLPSSTGTTSTGIIARSTDGTTWTRSTVVGPSEATFGTFFWFCEGASAVYTTFLEATTQKFFAGTRSSQDDGATFTTTSTQVSLDTDQIAGLDPSCAASGNDVWVMYATTKAPSADVSTIDGANHLYVAHSANGAATFENARADALDVAADELATIPLMVRDPMGKLDVAYVAGNAADDANGFIRFTRTTGTTSSASTLVDGPMLFDLSRTTQTWVGDYFGGVLHDGAFYLAYPRNETGLDHIYFAKTALP